MSAGRWAGPQQQEGLSISENAAVVIWALFNSDYVPSRSHDGMTTHVVVVTELAIELAGAIPGVKIKRPVDTRGPLKMDRI